MQYVSDLNVFVVHLQSKKKSKEVLNNFAALFAPPSPEPQQAVGGIISSLPASLPPVSSLTGVGRRLFGMHA